VDEERGVITPINTANSCEENNFYKLYMGKIGTDLDLDQLNWFTKSSGQIEQTG
jgi:hypothetical protein